MAPKKTTFEKATQNQAAKAKAFAEAKILFINSAGKKRRAKQICSICGNQAITIRKSCMPCYEQQAMVKASKA